MKLTGFQLKMGQGTARLEFYVEVLGVTLVETKETHDGTLYFSHFRNKDYRLTFFQPNALDFSEYRHDVKDNYWKFSLFVDDIRRVYDSLMKRKHPISVPYQFLDIGYLSHTKDLENYNIEFIQKTFASNNKYTEPDYQFLLGECPVLGLLTIRTKDPIKSIRFFEEICQLKLFVRMYVNRGKGFTLYFLGDQKLTPPSANIDALENREWMYQQDHLFVEMQHYWGSEYEAGFELNRTEDSALGLRSIQFKGDLQALKARLRKGEYAFEELNRGQVNNEIHIETIDHQKIIVLQE